MKAPVSTHIERTSSVTTADAEDGQVAVELAQAPSVQRRELHKQFITMYSNHDHNKGTQYI